MNTFLQSLDPNNIFAYLAGVLIFILLILGVTVAYARFSFKDLLAKQHLFNTRLDAEGHRTDDRFPE